MDIYYIMASLKNLQISLTSIHEVQYQWANCTIEPYDDALKLPSKYFAFKATHTNFGGGAMCLACLGKEEREEWMAIMRDCRRITYENALLGDAMIEKLNNASSQLTSENQKALEEFQANALRLEQKREAHEAATSKK